MKLYLVGSLRNPEITAIAEKIRQTVPKLEVFDDWMAAGPEADDFWKKYEMEKGHDYTQALDGYAARHVFDFDRHHLDTSDIVVLALPAGRSGHLELGYAAGSGKRTYILLDKDYKEEGRFDVMYLFANKVCRDVGELLDELRKL